MFKYHIEKDKTPDILFLSVLKFEKISLNGDLMESNAVQELIEKFIDC